MTIPVERCIGGPDLSEPQLAPDGSLLVYVRSTAGGSALMLSLLDGAPPRQLSSYPPPRGGRGLGGGCWAWLPDSSAVVYTAIDGNLWMQPVPGGAVRRVTDLEQGRAAQAPAVAPTGGAIAYVVDQGEIWLQPLDGGQARRLDDGTADFCFDPSFVAADDIADPGAGDVVWVVWQAWNVPDMAWDASRMERVNTSTGERGTIVGVGAIQQPRGTPAGLLSVRDDTGWNNVWLDDHVLVDEPFEHAGPTWGMGQRSFAASPDGSRVAFTRNESGFGRLCVVDVATGTVEKVAQAVHGQLSWCGSRLAALRTGARTPPQIVVYDTRSPAKGSWERTFVDFGSYSGWDDEALVEPELLDIVARDGATIHARLYRADDSNGRLICWLHGGPIDQWQVTFMPRLAFWRSRGFDILVPDHRGSTGHGREYQQALNGRWGDIDVTDTIDAVRHAHASGLADAAGTVLIGGSSGGFTALGVLAAEPALVCCAVVAYAVCDLFDVSVRGDRFERHMTHHLVGPIPATAPVDGPYVERSPISLADRISTPLLMFHGDADPVVPVEQSKVMADHMRAGGADVDLVVYAGEGHGFRQPPNQLDEYRRMEDFINSHVAGHIASDAQ